MLVNTKLHHIIFQLFWFVFTYAVFHSSPNTILFVKGSCDSRQCYHWSITTLVDCHVSMTTDLKQSMATEHLQVVGPELDIFLYIIYLYHSRRAEQLLNEVTGSCLSATSTFFCHVYVVLHNWHYVVQLTTEISFTQTCAVHPAAGSARGRETFTPQMNCTRARWQRWDPLFWMLSVRLFWCALECRFFLFSLTQVNSTHDQKSFGLT